MFAGKDGLRRDRHLRVQFFAALLFVTFSSEREDLSAQGGAQPIAGGTELCEIVGDAGNIDEV
jgi:hypothetical protein